MPVPRRQQPVSSGQFVTIYGNDGQCSVMAQPAAARGQPVPPAAPDRAVKMSALFSFKSHATHEC